MNKHDLVQRALRLLTQPKERSNPAPTPSTVHPGDCITGTGPIERFSTA